MNVVVFGEPTDMLQEASATEHVRTWYLLEMMSRLAVYKHFP